MLGLIGGSGLDELDGLTHRRRQVVRTPYGEPSCALTFGRLGGNDVVFMARHGHAHTLPPHKINYRANIWALREVGAKQIMAIATVGGIRQDCAPGTLVVPDQLIDYTHGRENTFFDSSNAPVTHVDFTLPYDPGLRQQILKAGNAAKASLLDGATYGCTQGPRLETAAEILRMERDGADLVGMTGMPEAGLARELQLPYAVLAVVANYAAGLGDSRERISLEAIAPVLDEAMTRAKQVIINFS